jgi:hypothetical protein
MFGARCNNCSVYITGAIIARIVKLDLPTFAEFQAACIKAVAEAIPILNVEELEELPDYDWLFQDFNDGQITGVEDLHLLRLEGVNADGVEGVRAHYKEDLRDFGYSPRPAYQGKLAYLHWEKYFKAPELGKIFRVRAIPPSLPVRMNAGMFI